MIPTHLVWKEDSSDINSQVDDFRRGLLKIMHIARHFESLVDMSSISNLYSPITFL